MVDDRSLFICSLTRKVYNFYVAPNVDPVGPEVLKHFKFSLFLEFTHCYYMAEINGAH